MEVIIWGVPLVALVAGILAVCRKFIPNFDASTETAVGMVLMTVGVFFGQVLPGLETAYPIIMEYVKWGLWAITAGLIWGGFWPVVKVTIWHYKSRMEMAGTNCAKPD